MWLMSQFGIFRPLARQTPDVPGYFRRMRRNVVSAGFACAAVLMLVAVTATLGVFPPAAVAAAPFIQDSFSRTVASGLGSAPTGGEYTQPQAAGWRVDGSQVVEHQSVSVILKYRL